ncbi:MAG: PqqD family protein [Paludibacter sp.]|nr:PqqD family protein [Paludibacter sp.]
MEIESLFQLKSKFVTREVGNELIVVPLSANVAQMNELFTLNETAKVIWENLNEGIDMSTLIQTITDTFDIDRQTAEKDIAVFLQTLEAMLKK